MAQSVFVMGATGNVGRWLVTALAERGESVRAASRDPGRARLTANQNAAWVEFDVEQPDTFATSLEGCDRMFLISRPGDELADQHVRPLIEAIEESSVQHIVHLSAMGTEERPDFSLRKVERLVEATGIPYTHLRPNFFMQVYSTGALRDSIRNAGRIVLPAGDAGLSLIDARDVAAVAATVLRAPQAHTNRAYTLTGGRPVSHHEIAAIIARATGRSVQYIPVDDDTMSGILKSIGMPEDRIARLLEMYRLVRLGKCEPLAPDVEQLLARRPLGFPEFVAQHVDAWT